MGDGRQFVFSDLHDGAVSVSCQADGYASVMFPVKAKDSGPLSITMYRPASVYGRIIDSFGLPFKPSDDNIGVWLEVANHSDYSKSGYHPYTPRADYYVRLDFLEDGRFIATDLSPGRYVVCIDRYEEVIKQDPFELKEGQTIELEVRLGTTVGISGRVTGPGGMPLQGLVLWCAQG